jgi:putative ABC transport system substrate-binding protein
VRRRDFITLIGGAAAAWPLPATAEQRTVQVIGLLNGISSPSTPIWLAALRQGLAEAGFVEGRNLAIVYRSAEGITNRLPAMAAELVSLQVAAIAAVGGDSSVLSPRPQRRPFPLFSRRAASRSKSVLLPALTDRAATSPARLPWVGYSRPNRLASCATWCRS